MTTAVAADIDIRVLWVSTKANPADAPSRGAELPSRGVRPPWSQRFWERAVGVAEQSRDCTKVCQRVPVGGVGQRAETVVHTKGGGRRYTAHDALSLKHPACREFYAGTGHCSAALRRRGLDTVEYELFNNGVENP